MKTLDPASVVKAVIDAANEGDVDGMVDRFAEHAVLRLEPQIPGLRPVYQGRLEVREYVERIVRDGFKVDASDFQATSNGVSWRSRVSGGLFGRARAEVTSQAIVQVNQILSITIHYNPETIRKLQATKVEQA